MRIVVLYQQATFISG